MLWGKVIREIIFFFRFCYGKVCRIVNSERCLYCFGEDFLRKFIKYN